MGHYSFWLLHLDCKFKNKKDPSKGDLFIGGELGIRTLGGLTLTAFRVINLSPHLTEVSGSWKKINGFPDLLDLPLFWPPKWFKPLRLQVIRTVRKSVQKPVIWRANGEQNAIWRANWRANWRAK